MHLLLVAHDEIHHWFRILARHREVTLALGHQHRDPPAEFLVSLLHHPCLVLQPWVETPTVVQNRNPGLGQRRQVVDRRRLRHQTAQERITGVNHRDLVRVRDRPRVRLAPLPPRYPPSPPSSQIRCRPSADRPRPTAFARPPARRLAAARCGNPWPVAPDPPPSRARESSDGTPTACPAPTSAAPR